nr:carbohydrate-binding domain-containing protein [Eubacterium sp.]
MKKSKKVTIVKRIVAFIIVFLMVLNSNPYQISEVNAAIQETINIKASEINSYINSSSRPDFINSIQSTNNGINLTLFDYNGRPFNLVMDQELKFNELTVSSSISISGSSKLTVNKQILISSNFTIEKNANVVFNSDSTLTVQGSAYCEGNIQLYDAFKLSSNNDFCLRGGSITGSAQLYVFHSMNGNISIEGGIVDVTCTKDCFEAANNINVSGGEINTASTSGSPFYAHYDFNFTGGTINASTNTTSYSKGTVVVGRNIVIADDCVIKKPSGYQIGKYNCEYNTIADSSGTKAKSVTIK